MNELQSPTSIVNTIPTATTNNSLMANESNSKQKKIPASEFQYGLCIGLDRKSAHCNLSQSTSDRVLNDIEKGVRWIGEHPCKTLLILNGITAPFIFRDCFVAYHNTKRSSKKRT